MKQVEDWNFVDDKVVYEFDDGSKETVERSEFRDYVDECWDIRVGVSEFIPYTFAEGEYDREEKEFFNNYFNRQNKNETKKQTVSYSMKTTWNKQ